MLTGLSFAYLSTGMLGLFRDSLDSFRGKAAVKWSLDLGIAVALTVLVWAALYFTFPDAPLGVAETVFILAVFYGLIKLIHLARKHLGSSTKADG